MFCFSFSLTACEQFLLHTCDWLGLKRFRINAPRVPHSDISLLYPAMHPQYVTITQKILSLKFSVAYTITIRDYKEKIKEYFCFGSCFGWQALGSSPLHVTYHQLVMVSSPMTRCTEYPTPAFFPTDLGTDYAFHQSWYAHKIHSSSLFYATNFLIPRFWNTKSNTGA